MSHFESRRKSQTISKPFGKDNPEIAPLSLCRFFESTQEKHVGQKTINRHIAPSMG
jgi:hypothetical protein